MRETAKPRLAFMIVCTGLLLASCATAPTSAPPASTSAQAATAGAAATATPRGAAEFPGFRLTVRQGEQVYCQTRSPTGSRARVVETCYTREAMLKMAEDKDDFFKQIGAGGANDTLRTDSPN
jgi:hypothetical protein